MSFFWKSSKFIIISGFAVSFDFLTYWSLVKLGLPAGISNLLSAPLPIYISYFLHSKLTFQIKRSSKKLLLYFAWYGATTLIFSTLIQALVSNLLVPELGAKAIMLPISLTVNYFGIKKTRNNFDYRLIFFASTLLTYENYVNLPRKFSSFARLTGCGVILLSANVFGVPILALNLKWLLGGLLIAGDICALIWAAWLIALGTTYLYRQIPQKVQL